MYHSFYTVASIAIPITNVIENKKGKLMVIFYYTVQKAAIDKHDQLRKIPIMHS